MGSAAVCKGARIGVQQKFVEGEGAVVCYLAPLATGLACEANKNIDPPL